MRDASLATVPTLLGYEKATNPFLRWDVPAVQEARCGVAHSVLDRLCHALPWRRRQLADYREQLMYLQLYESGRSYRSSAAKPSGQAMQDTGIRPRGAEARL